MLTGSSNNAEAVKTQYSTANGLNTRMSLHEKYSTNAQGYGNWIASHYDIRAGMSVLELGCGTGSIWTGRDALINRCGRLVLSDLSEGMLRAARDNVGDRSNVEYLRADIQDLPLEDGSFDAVIANAMLYHVPDLDRGISEVRRVLKDDGTFYCSTYGEHNFAECLAQWFRLSGEGFEPNYNFTLQNGGAALSKHFADIEALFYEDSLRITETEDMVDYLKSLVSLKAVGNLPDEKILDILNAHAENGVLTLPKEYGMFVARGKR